MCPKLCCFLRGFHKNATKRCLERFYCYLNVIFGNESFHTASGKEFSVILLQFSAMKHYIGKVSLGLADRIRHDRSYYHCS